MCRASGPPPSPAERPRPPSDPDPPSLLPPSVAMSVPYPTPSVFIVSTHSLAHYSATAMLAPHFHPLHRYGQGGEHSHSTSTTTAFTRAAKD